jgi:cell division septal protein FtsQ
MAAKNQASLLLRSPVGKMASQSFPRRNSAPILRVKRSHCFLLAAGCLLWILLILALWQHL